MRLTALLVEPYHTGSHAAWAEGYAATSRHRVELLTLPGRFWKWRMHGGAVTLAQRLLASDLQPDVILATDMLDLSTFLALTRRRLGNVPVAMYFHENQLAYPGQPIDPAWDASRRRRARAGRRDLHYPFLNYTSALTADRVWWNSAYNRDSFLDALPNLLKHFPDFNDLHNVAAIGQKSQVMPLGMDLAFLDAHRPDAVQSGPPLILWNHRWEYDKGPETFFRALKALAQQGRDFKVAVLGESFREAPQEFMEARQWLGERIVQFGYTKTRADYARWLWQADIVVSCARHEFFGASVAEAVYCNAWPLLPHRLVYPELLPPNWHSACLYHDFDDLVAKLTAAMSQTDSMRRRSLRDAVAPYDWSVVAPRYDAALARLVS